VPQAFSVKGERPRTHAQLKKNTMKTNTNSDSGLQNRTAQRDERQPEFKVKTSWIPIPLALAFTLRAFSGGRKGFQF
jgi:hypothetical protein